MFDRIIYNNIGIRHSGLPIPDPPMVDCDGEQTKLCEDCRHRVEYWGEEEEDDN